MGCIRFATLKNSCTFVSMSEMPELKIVYKNVADLVPYVNNHNTHPEKQILEIMGSIREFGFVDPVSVDGSNGIITGHGSVIAAERLGLVQVPTVELSHLSDRQKKAFVIAHNKIARNSVFDFDKLAEEMNSLVDADFDISLTGFDEQEIDSLLKLDRSLFPDELDSEKKPPAPPAEIARKKEASKIVHTCPNCDHKFTA